MAVTRKKTTPKANTSAKKTFVEFSEKPVSADAISELQRGDIVFAKFRFLEEPWSGDIHVIDANGDDFSLAASEIVGINKRPDLVVGSRVVCDNCDSTGEIIFLYDDDNGDTWAVMKMDSDSTPHVELLSDLSPED